MTSVVFRRKERLIHVISPIVLKQTGINVRMVYHFFFRMNIVLVGGIIFDMLTELHVYPVVIERGARRVSIGQSPEIKRKGIVKR